MKTDKQFKEWLAGLIDGDGCFLLSKKGYGSLEITVDVRDIYCLSVIKQRYGGSIKLRAGTKSIRYRLHHKKGLVFILTDLNGLLRHSIRLLQFNKLCIVYSILILDSNILSFNSNWMAGFFDADGAVSINSTTYQLSLSISQKTKELLSPLMTLYGGNIYIDRSSNTFCWYITKKETLLLLVNHYFKNVYVYSKKRNRLFLIEEYYNLINLKKEKHPFFNKLWIIFFKKWSSYSK